MPKAKVRLCDACGAWLGYARPICYACGGSTVTIAALPVAGTVYSLSTVHRAGREEAKAKLPFTIALIRGPKGGLILTETLGEMAIDDAVTITAGGDGLIAQKAPVIPM